MKTTHRPIHWLLIGLLTIGTLPSCAPKFDKIGFDNAANLVTVLQELIAKSASGKYSASTELIQKATKAVNDAVTHAASVKKNKEVAEAWKTFQNELFNPYLERWKEKGMMDKETAKETGTQFTKSLEAIKKAEMAKRKG